MPMMKSFSFPSSILVFIKNSADFVSYRLILGIQNRRFAEMFFSGSGFFPQSFLIKNAGVFAHWSLASLASSHRFFNHSVSGEANFIRHLWGKHDMS
ncbi:hypothetical protein MH051_02300 [Bacillus safensis]|uniref:hypothetical protein n=1 Tax=Bacillus safensis TaxID=561879 RepID=UPI002280C6EB|nr:hypothetical protein [Bacillus safensis]